jgi:hypothetical protein
MSIIDILVILGCLAGGYWIVSSVMGPGVDITRRETPSDAAPGSPRGTAQLPAPTPRTGSAPRQADWHLLLDVPRSASRAEIDAAYKRQLEKALASGDPTQQEQLRLARDAGLAGHSLPQSLRS